MPDTPLPRFYAFDEDVFQVGLHEPSPSNPVPEAFLHDLWQHLRFNTRRLSTHDGLDVTVLDPGRLNTDAGPDFLDAHLRIDGTEWHGDVEIHRTSATWQTHRHPLDPRYNSVVLHVVLYADMWTGMLKRPDGTALPELVLYPHLEAPLRGLLHHFFERPADRIPCADGWPHVNKALKTDWIRRLAEERLAQRTEQLALRYQAAPDLAALLHERLFTGLGYAKNALPMALLARRIPLTLARRHPDRLDLEALHYGVAGLLPLPSELLDTDRSSADYIMDLRYRFERLNIQCELPSMLREQWRFFRLRPANFPPLRIAQGIGWLLPGGLLQEHPIRRLLEALRAANPEDALRDLLATRPGVFWQTHVRFEKRVRQRQPALGRVRLQALIVNAVIPVLLLHSVQTGDVEIARRCTALLTSMPAPHDEVAARYQALGTRSPHAFFTQGLYQLFMTRCQKGACLSCPIGQTLFGSQVK